MGDSEEMAPAVASILEAARARGSDRNDGSPGASEKGRDGAGGDGRGAGGDDRAAGEHERVDVDARSLTDAFADAEADGRVPLIAEVKPTSPTTDGERDDDPVALAEGMVAGGAAALSVLTEPEHFGGSTATLERVRAAVDVPVLRKDFVLREAQLDAVAADVVLLIARFLEEPDTGDLAELIAAARERGFQVLVETHTVAEVERAVEAGADVVGVNNRDLAELEVDLTTFEGVAPHVPDDVTLIAESGIETPADVRRMRAAGADALLVGSAIMAGDVTERTRTLVTAEAGEAGETDEADEASDAGVAGGTGEAGGEGPTGETNETGGDTDDGPGTE